MGHEPKLIWALFPSQSMLFYLSIMWDLLDILSSHLNCIHLDTRQISLVLPETQ